MSCSHGLKTRPEQQIELSRTAPIVSGMLNLNLNRS